METYYNQGAPQDIYNRNAEWGPAMNDIKMRSVTTAMYELPLTKWMHTNGRVSNMLLGGWSVSGVFTGQTGLPQNITNLFATGNTDRPAQCMRMRSTDLFARLPGSWTPPVP